jgi:hypothetical protein
MKGIIIGRFVQPTSKTPLHGPIVYLGNLVPLTPGPAYTITIDVQASPNSLIDPEGNFSLYGVTPGTYALIVWTPVKSQVVVDPNQPDKELLVTVSAGQTVDLGEVEVNWQS